jgi:hypothetical protein
MIYYLVDNQFQKMTTPFGRVEVDFKICSRHKIPFDKTTNYVVTKFTFCIERQRKFYIYAARHQVNIIKPLINILGS